MAHFKERGAEAGYFSPTIHEQPQKGPSLIGLSQNLNAAINLEKLHHHFYDIYLLILWRKSLLQSFVSFCSDFTKLLSYKIRNSLEVTSHPRINKTFHGCVFCTFCSFIEKKSPIQFYSAFNHFSRTYEVARFWKIKGTLMQI